MAGLAEIAVVGGSGFYEFLGDAEEIKVDTPFGAPSDPVTVGEVAGRRVAFLPRHGRDHRFPPHKIPYRANMWALRSVGVRRVLPPPPVGSLSPSYPPPPPPRRPRRRPLRPRPRRHPPPLPPPVAPPPPGPRLPRSDFPRGPGFP